MAKKRDIFECVECGAKSSKWSGRCTVCSSWNSIEELVAQTGEVQAVGKALKPQSSLLGEHKKLSRISTGIKDVDDLVGGGFVHGSVVLLSGEPGIGKSTLLMQVANKMSQKQSVLYVSGEESVHQIAQRANRLAGSDTEEINIVDTNSADDVAATLISAKYGVVIVDSIQTMRVVSSSSTAGGVAQVNAVGQLLARAAKSSNTILILVGHVTKDGTLAGPKVLEHLVDVVLNITGDRYSTLRILRSQKNRYGPTDELIMMDMGNKGLTVVSNASAELLKERQISDGSVVLAAMDGNQPLLVEVQALVNTSSFGYPKRASVGFELNRLNLIVAMLERRTKLNLADKDIYLNIVGGFKLQDPGADLAVCMAIASATKTMEIKDDAVVFGEVGLSGEIRHVSGMEKRFKEAKKLGFKRVIGPPTTTIKDSIYIPTATVKEALNNNLKKG